MAEQELTLSVVIISWNQCPLLKDLVAQLLNQDFPSHRYEIIIVDDGSADGTREWLSKLDDARIRILLGDKDRGRGASRNAGIRAARHDIMVMIDGDHTVADDFLSLHARRHAMERCAIVGLSQFASHRDYHAINTYLNESGALKLPAGALLPGRYFLTRNCSVPKDVLESVGLFDERFSRWGGEDLELGVRLEEAGVPIYSEPRALALHHHWRPLSSLLTNVFAYGRDSIPLLVDKHPQLFAELNLDHILIRQGTSRYSRVHRLCVRWLLISPFYFMVSKAVRIGKRHRLPRMLFDYLHYRQYAKGFMSYVKMRKDGLFAR